jgi:hypothetical protein
VAATGEDLMTVDIFERVRTPYLVASRSPRGDMR